MGSGEFAKLLGELGVIGWPVVILVTIKWYGLDKIAKQLYDNVLEPWLLKRVNLRNELLQQQITRYLSDRVTNDVLYAHYMSLARHVVSSAWRVKVALSATEINEDIVLDRLRTDARDVMGRVREALSELICYSTSARLDTHLKTLDEVKTRQFYAPIVAAIITNGQGSCDYEGLRFIILGEVDGLLNEAIDLVMYKSKKKDKENGRL